MALTAKNADAEPLKVIRTTQTFSFQPRPPSLTHNDLAIPDAEFFTDAFILKSTNNQIATAADFFANHWQSLDQIVQATTNFPDFESFKMAAFSDYLERNFTK